VAEPGADLHRRLGRPVDEFEGRDLLVVELQHGQGGTVPMSTRPPPYHGGFDFGGELEEEHLPPCLACNYAV
jgi:hypothetical protein